MTHDFYVAAAELAHARHMLRLSRELPPGSGTTFLEDHPSLTTFLAGQAPSPESLKRSLARAEKRLIARARRGERVRRSRAARRRVRVVAGFTLLASAGCGESFGELTAYNDAFAEETSETPSNDDPNSPGSGWHSVTSDGASVSSTGDVSGAPDEGAPTGTTGPGDEPPKIFLLRVNGSYTPEPMTAAGPVTISVHAIDDHGVAAVHLWSSEDHDQPLAIVPGNDDDLAYTYTWSVDHQDDAGEYTYWAVAYDDAGQTDETAKVTLTVALPESGTQMWYRASGPHEPNESIVWNDVAVLPSGELIVVGHREVEGQSPTLLVERRTAEGELIANGLLDAVPGRSGTAIAVADDGTLVAAALDDKVDSWVARFTINGDLLFQAFDDGVQWRDVAVVQDRIIVAGNIGKDGDGPTTARTRGLTPTLEAFWSRSEYGEGDSNLANAIATTATRVFVGGHVMDGLDVLHAAVWAYNREDGAPLWSVVFDEDREDIHDVTLTTDNRLVAVGAGRPDATLQMTVWNLSINGELISASALADTIGEASADTVAPASHGEFILGGWRCDGGCSALSRRYDTSPYLWEHEEGLSDASRVLGTIDLDHGYTLLHGWHAINYGEGPVLTSWMHVVHP